VDDAEAGGRFVLTSPSLARCYFGAQAIAGAAWWIAVFASDDVQRWTLGGWDHQLLVVPDLLLFVGASALAAVTASRSWAAVASLWTVAVTAALVISGLAGQEAGWGAVAMVIASVGTLVATSVLWLGGLPAHWFFVGPFAFRVAEDRPGAHHLRRSLVQLVVFWSTFFLVVPAVLVAVERRLQLTAPGLGHQAVAAAGWCTFLGASAIGLWSCVTMALQGHGTPLPSETARDLVVAGPYRFVRNPMAVAGALQTIGVGLIFGSWTVVAIALGGAVAWNVVIRPGEEADLAARFGAPYEAYRARVRCWVPTAPGPLLARGGTPRSR
jgi:protein-S-isoprenylcysteine O-methyltransferase Ste14